MAKVCIKWSEFSFYIDYTPLTSADSVQQEVAQAITESLRFINLTSGQECDRFFIALLQEELSLVGRCVSDPIQCQVSLRQSIVLQGRDHFWKYNPDTHESTKLFGYFWLKGTLLIRNIGSLAFLGVERYERPLSRGDAKCCLYSLVEKVIPVLKHLHQVENVAHLDVKLDNICFKRHPDTIVMIDFDRHKNANKPAALHLTYTSVMYSAKEGWLCKNLDWKQLGLMIY